LHQRHVAEPCERDVQRSRNRRRRESQYVGLELEVLQPLFVLHAKAMLLVNDNHAEVLEANVGAQQAMSSYYDVGGSIGE
jgi:hypothetical protein